ncbi:MAG: hypothetical protein ACTSRS_02765 [Candidatus Helarchaeota archaeon]
MAAALNHLRYPRALYDPIYIPPQLLHRSKELNCFFTLFNSSLDPTDQFPLNTLVYGIRGVGKTVFVNYSIRQLKSQSETNFIALYFNLANKTRFENLRLIVEKYSYQLSKHYMYLHNSKELWSYFQFLRKKDDHPLILLLDNVEGRNLTLYEKLICYSNDLQISTIATSSLSTKNSHFCIKNIADQLNFELFLDIYSPSALHDILLQRINLTLPTLVNSEFSHLITDIVIQHDYYRPSTCIEILKALYESLLKGIDIEPNLIREVSNHLVEFPFSDDLEFLIQFDNSSIDLLSLPLLQKIYLYFKNTNSTYIKRTQLINLYKITCEELEISYRPAHFYKILQTLLNNSFLYNSQFPSNNKEPQFFILLDPETLLIYLESKFPKFSN